MTRTHRLAWMALVVNVLVILGGALVRATGSGAGCGASWPTCEGQIVPASLSGATGIEFAHRLFSGVALLIVFALFIVVRRDSTAGVQTRRAAIWALVTIIIEALIGAGIVLFEWVADDASIARTVAVPLHLVNTLLLLASLSAVTAFTGWAGPVRQRDDTTARLIRWGFGALVVVAATGAVTALADVLFPVESLAEGLAQDFGSTESALTRVRIVHPVIAFGASLVVLKAVSSPVEGGARFSRAVTMVVGAQLVAGILNVVLLVPVWMQIVHLALADFLWIAFVFYAMVVLGDNAVPDNSSGRVVENRQGP